MTSSLVPTRDKIERATLTGENRQIIMHGVPYPYAMTVFQQDIFWTDWTENAVFRAQKDGGSGFAVLAQDLQYRPNDIHVYAASKQESCSSPCQQFNGGCSHICVSGKSRLLICTKPGTQLKLHSERQL